MGFRQRYVHLDLKGAPPSVEFLERLFPMLHGMGATGYVQLGGGVVHGMAL